VGNMKITDFDFELPEHLIAKYPAEQRTSSMLERVLSDNSALAHIRASKSPKEGTILHMEGGLQVKVLGRKDGLFHVDFDGSDNVFELLEEYGHMPLPPYIDRPDEDSDKERYQTVYNKNTAFVTLHVGAGTFQPVRVENIEDHQMHAEYAEVTQEVVDLVKATKAAGKRVVAVGTTSVRSLESAAHQASDTLIAPFLSDTNIFIYPGFEFKVVDAMITNFHLPQSTLMMLIIDKSL